MAADDEGALGGPSAAAVLAVAEGLRRCDPQLSAALAEHAARLSHDDDRRGEAELSAVLARRELDRPDELARRGVPALRGAELGARDRDAALLRCALADAALIWSDTAVAEALVEPLGDGGELPEHVRLVLVVTRADLAAALGDPDAVDALATEAETLSATREEQVLARADVGRARARARVARGDLPGARQLLTAATEAPVPDAVDGGRRRLLVVGDLLEVLVALDEQAVARTTAAPVLERAGEATTALPLARVRCLAASGVHLPARELGEAEALARTVIDGLIGSGHDHRVAAAEEILAAVAEARGDLPAALAAQRRAHRLERGALAAEGAARVELASAVTSVAGPGTVVRDPAPLRRRASAATGNGVPPLTAAPAARQTTDGAGEASPEPRSVGRRSRPDIVDTPRRVSRNASAPPTDGHGRADDERLAASAPHGLSRILDEITADARSTPVGDPASSHDDHRDLGPTLGATRLRDVGHARDQHDRAPARGAASASTGGSTGASAPPSSDEYAEDLRLTLVDLLAEYGDDRGDTAGGRSAQTANGNGTGDAARATSAPPTAWSFHGATTAPGATPRATAAGPPASPADGDPPVPRRGDRPTAPDAPGACDTSEVDSGARLADLLADAMDAFRRSAPAAGTIGPVLPDRRPEYRGARR